MNFNNGPVPECAQLMLWSGIQWARILLQYCVMVSFTYLGTPLRWCVSSSSMWVTRLLQLWSGSHMDISYHSHTISSGVFPVEGESYKTVHTFNCLFIMKPIALHLLPRKLLWHCSYSHSCGRYINHTSCYWDTELVKSIFDAFKAKRAKSVLGKKLLSAAFLNAKFSHVQLTESFQTSNMSKATIEY